MDKIKDQKIDRVVFLDESGIDDNEVYERSWGLIGPRICGSKPGFKKN